MRLQVKTWAKRTEAQDPTYLDLKRFVDANALPAGFKEGSLPQLDTFWSNMSQNTWILSAKTYDLKWSFYVFHSLNDTGLPLTDVDKLKAHVLDRWVTPDSQAKHAAAWDDCMAMVGGEEVYERILRYVAIAHGMGSRVALLDYMVSCC